MAKNLLKRIAIAGGLAAMLAHSAYAAQQDVWLGTDSSQLSKGIYHTTLDTETGKLSESRLVAQMNGPGFLALHPNGKVLYAVGALNGQDVVAAYALAAADGKPGLKLMNSLPIGDGGAAHLAIDPTARTLITAQYGGGSVAAFSLNADGSLLARTELIKQQGGAKVVPGRQDGSHAHWAGFSPDNRYAFIPDLGLDKVVIYKVDAATAKLTPHGFGAVPPGGGPRHMKFHPNGKWIYVLNELDLSVSVFDYDAAAGRMTLKNTIPTVSKADLAKERFTSASEIHVHPSGKFVYSANRGHDTITAFAVDAASGDLSVISRTNVRGATPRNFSLDPAGKWLLAAGQDSHSLASFAVNQQTGELTYNRSVIHTPSPICVLFGGVANGSK
ncbi:lactonase family protein [Pseudoduganella namucuonensis]|uniref:6-phosphogluconolactonase n=1 Tax=Pseudoduganella namucuonensis TaxID=1035707 RepID=A0A1I7L573_9BURK|nr:lactonase family protein [Pseudoduganella namucuonensis]SFV04877.1 6-phosphogluconolactonase [Pseudoduganella namucuonensis]